MTNLPSPSYPEASLKFVLQSITDLARALEPPQYVDQVDEKYLRHLIVGSSPNLSLGAVTPPVTNSHGRVIPCVLKVQLDPLNRREKRPSRIECPNETKTA